MIPAQMLAQLLVLKAMPKFVEEPDAFYRGMRPEHDRRLAEGQFNDLIDRLMQCDPVKPVVLAEFAVTLAAFPGHDTEDRERVCGYLEQVMDVFGIESSDGLLNRWLYGIDLVEIIKARPV